VRPCLQGGSWCLYRRDYLRRESDRAHQTELRWVRLLRASRRQKVSSYSIGTRVVRERRARNPCGGPPPEEKLDLVEGAKELFRLFFVYFSERLIELCFPRVFCLSSSVDASRNPGPGTYKPEKTNQATGKSLLGISADPNTKVRQGAKKYML